MASRHFLAVKFYVRVVVGEILNNGMWDSGSPRALGTRLGTFDSCHPDHFGDLRISENSTE